MKTVRLSLDVPEEFLTRLDIAVRQYGLTHPKQRRMSEYEWGQTSSGRAWMFELNSDPKYKRMDIKHINKLQRERYLEYVGPTRFGRPPLHDDRIAVLTEALELYQNSPSLKRVA